MAAGPEIELVVRAVRPNRQAGENRDRIRALLQTTLDWDRVLGLARMHGVTPLLWRELRSVGSDLIPDQVQDRLRARNRSIAAHNLYLANELTELWTAFDTNGIRALPFKGPVLAQSTYDDVALREFADLDLLVHRDDLPAAVDCLQSLGYVWEDGVPRLDDSAILGGPFTPPIMAEYTLRKNDVELEVRWRVGEDSKPFDLGVGRLLERREEVELAGSSIPSLSPEDRLLVLAYHGVKHGWHQLKWVVDFAAAAERLDTTTLSTVLERAAIAGVRRKVLIGFDLVATLFDIDLPTRIEDAIREDRRARSLAAESRGRLLGADVSRPTVTERLRYMVMASDSVSDAIPVILNFGPLHPNFPDYRLLPLKGPLHPVYYLLRPIRLVAERAPSLRGISRSGIIGRLSR